MRELITITGDVGSGKSTAGKILAAALGYTHVSTGAMQRAIAASRGVTTLELNEASMNDRAVDDALDSHLLRLNTEGERLVLDSRMAWHFVQAAFKVFVTVDPCVGARRVLADSRREEKHLGLADAVRNNLRRKAIEDARFARLYGVRCDAIENFDLVIDSTYVSPECVAGTIQSVFGRDPSQAQTAQGRLCPKRLLPTRSVRDVSGSDRLSRDLGVTQPVEVAPLGNYFFLLDGHQRTSAAIRMGLEHIPCVFRSVSEQVGAALQKPWTHEWETAHGFQFASSPDAQGNPRLE